VPIRHNIWKVGQPPFKLQESILASEKLLEDMIVAAPEIISDQWMIIGRQEETGFGGRIDLLAIAPDGALILIELKRERTPREVVAQAIDYAVWLEALDAEDIADIYSRYAPGHNLAHDFRSRFDSDLDEATLNQAHQIVIVASTLDSSSERIVSYLSERGISINVLCFQMFALGTEQLLSRAWLIDPVESQISSNVSSARKTKEPWNGEYYVSFGHGQGRSWDEAREFGFVSAGGGAWYSNTLNLLNVGSRIWVKAPGHGFVGVG
jgi:Endonuclease NucS